MNTRKSLTLLSLCLAILWPLGVANGATPNLFFSKSDIPSLKARSNPGWTRVLDAAEYGGQAANLSAGRYPDGAPTIRELITPTPGTTNSAWLAHDIVINEIMYHPISENDEDEYVELYNRGTNELDASYWRLEGAVDYTFPTNLAIDHITCKHSIHKLLLSPENDICQLQ